MWRQFFIVVILFFLLHASHSYAAKSNGYYGYEECNWLVTYRNRTYDLTPLTRVGLSRPIESDLRPVLERVGESTDALRLVGEHARNAKAHSIIGSAAISFMVLDRILHASIKGFGDEAFNFSTKALHINGDKGLRISVDVLAFVGGLIFLKATYESWHETRASKTELVNAIESFNEKSPYKIEAAKGASNAETH